jgi:hypothetical protein
VASPIQWSARCKELIAESPFKSMSEKFLHFPLKTGVVICSGNRLPAID